MWRRLRAVIPERRGVAILDGTSFPKQGPHSVGVTRQYCGALGKIANCQVATTTRCGRARAWILGRHVVSAGQLAHPRRAATRADSGQRGVSREMASRAHLAATGARRWLHRDGGRRRCGIWRCLDVPGRLASPAVAVCVRDFVEPGRMPAPTARGPREPRRAGSAHPHAPIDRWVARRGGPRVAHALPAAAWRVVAWRNGSNSHGVARASRRSASPRRTIGAGDARARGLVALRRGSRTRRAAQGLPRRTARTVRCARWSPWRISGGRSSSSIRNSKRARAQSFRRTHLPRVAAPRRADGGRPRCTSNASACAVAPLG